MTELKGTFASPTPAGTQAERASGTARPVDTGRNGGRGGYGAAPETTAPTFRGLAAPIRGGVSRRGGIEMLGELNTLMAEIIKEKGWAQAWDIKLMNVDAKTDPRLKISAILVAVRSKDQPELGVSWHNMILAGSIDSLPTKKLKVDDLTFDVTLTADNGNDTAMNNVVREMIEATFPGAFHLPIPATTVPSSFEIRNKEHVSILLSNGVVGCMTYITEAAGGETMRSLSEVATSMKFTASVKFDPQEKVDEVQMPVRNDFTIKLGTDQRTVSRDQTMELNDGSTPTELIDLRGMVDLRWYGPDEKDDRSTAMYTPSIVGTHVFTGDLTYVGVYGIAISLLNALRTNNAWINAIPFTTKPGDLNNIGILSMDTPLDPENPRRLEMTTFKADDEGRDDFKAFIKRLVYARPQICFDVAICGPLTWQLGFLADIANRIPGSREVFIKAMDDMTDGAFSPLIDAKDWLVRLDSDIHLGTYRNAAGQVRDKREIGYVQVANVALPNGTGRNNPLQLWSNTWTDHSVEPELRLERRLKIETDLFGPINVTGVAARFEFSAGLMDAVAQSFGKSRFQPLLTGFHRQLDQYERASFRGEMMGAGHAGEQFQRSSYGGYAGGNGQRGGYTSGNSGRGARRY